MRTLFTIFALGLSLTLAACGGDDDSGPGTGGAGSTGLGGAGGAGFGGEGGAGFGGEGGTGNAPPPDPICAADVSLESDDCITANAEGVVLAGSVNGQCSGFDCSGPDTFDDYPLRSNQARTFRFVLTWEGTADLDLYVFDGFTLEVLGESAQSDTSEELVELFLDTNDEVIVEVLASMTNGSTQAYTVAVQ